ncbi:MAG: type I phosphomannose isomerase catalytic subunit [Ruminococcus sp.]
MTEPLFLKGAVKDYIWGGNKLKTAFGKESDRENIAESWELSCNENGICTVMNGSDKGLSLTEYIEKHGALNVLGEDCLRTESVPIIKLIDAKEPLSVQVHPNDDYARKKGFRCGKSEMWYIIDAEEGAELVLGVNKCLAEEELRQHIADGTVERILRHVPVKKGDVFFIPAGTLHAIGKGILLAEVQQNSDITYRVYDYNRRDAEGNLRELHIEDAMRAASLKPVNTEGVVCDLPEEKMIWGSTRLLCGCDYFVTSLEKVNRKVTRQGMQNVYRHFLVLEGKGILTVEGVSYEMKKGDSILLPPMNGDYCMDGELEYLSTFSLDAEE